MEISELTDVCAPGSPKLANILLLSGLAAELGYRTPATCHLDAVHFEMALRHASGRSPSEIELTPGTFRQAHRDLLDVPLPGAIDTTLSRIYDTLAAPTGAALAVRSCFELEDSVRHAFAGTFASVLGVVTREELGAAVREVYASAFSQRALEELLSCGVSRLPSMWLAIQQSVGGAGWLGGVTQTQAADLAPFPLMALSVSSDVAFVTSASDLPEEYLLARDHVDTELGICVHRQPGADTIGSFSLPDDELRRLARIFLRVEEAFSEPLELEWLLRPDGELYLLQARPSPVEYASAVTVAAPEYADRLLCVGLPVGNGRVQGRLYFADTPEQALQAPPGSVLAVPGRTDADWAGAVRHASALVTAIGSRGSHFARIARDSRRLAVVGCGDSVFRLSARSEVTVFCAEGIHGAVYLGEVPAGELCCSIGDVVVRGAADAFTQARTTRPRRLFLDPGPSMFALRLPEAADADPSPRLARLASLHCDLEAFVAHRLLEEISLVGIAFRRSAIVVLPTVPDRWRPALTQAIELARTRFGLDVSVSPS